ncbi:hypothetical protein [Streptomyces roseolus]|nr:hypothetical protein [Streptomyces roseolus]
MNDEPKLLPIAGPPLPGTDPAGASPHRRSLPVPREGAGMPRLAAPGRA